MLCMIETIYLGVVALNESFAFINSFNSHLYSWEKLRNKERNRLTLYTYQ
jgi:hypothetical protein